MGVKSGVPKTFILRSPDCPDAKSHQVVTSCLPNVESSSCVRHPIQIQCSVHQPVQVEPTGTLDVLNGLNSCPPSVSPGGVQMQEQLAELDEMEVAGPICGN